MRKEYTTPQLLVHGSEEEMTLADKGPLGNDGCGQGQGQGFPQDGSGGKVCS